MVKTNLWSEVDISLSVSLTPHRSTSVVGLHQSCCEGIYLEPSSGFSRKLWSFSQLHRRICYCPSTCSSPDVVCWQSQRPSHRAVGFQPSCHPAPHAIDGCLRNDGNNTVHPFTSSLAGVNTSRRPQSRLQHCQWCRLCTGKGCVSVLLLIQLCKSRFVWKQKCVKKLQPELFFSAVFYLFTYFRRYWIWTCHIVCIHISGVYFHTGGDTVCNLKAKQAFVLWL